MKIIIVGLGFAESHLNSKYIRVPDRLDPSEQSVNKLIDQHRPDLIINCIAKTGRPTVDWCDQNREETLVANVTVPTMLAQACSRQSVRMLHIGSGCIFYGPSPNINDGVDTGWKETDSANPESYYSKTKYATDLSIQDLKNVCILRIRMPLSKRNVPRNYLSKILKYSSLINNANSITFMDDFARGVDWAVDKGKIGIYHLCNPEPVGAAQVVRRYHELAMTNPVPNIPIISENELNNITVAPRSNCIIDSSKIISEGFDIEPASRQLNNYLSEYISR